MNIPDVKSEAHKQIDSLQGSILGMVQIGADDTGHVAVCIGGIPDVIIKTLANVMKGNHQIKDLFEAAWCEANESPFNPNLN